MDSHLTRLQDALKDAIASFSENELKWHPPGRWCAAEVLEHLYLTYTGTTKGFSRVLEAGKPMVAPEDTFKQRVARLVVVGFSHMPKGRKAPRRAEPRGLPGDQVRTEISARIAEMDEIIERCDRELGGGKYRGQAMLDHPILGPLSAQQWRKFHFVHGMHHVKQIRRLRKAS